MRYDCDRNRMNRVLKTWKKLFPVRFKKEAYMLVTAICTMLCTSRKRYQDSFQFHFQFKRVSEMVLIDFY